MHTLFYVVWHALNTIKLCSITQFIPSDIWVAVYMQNMPSVASSNYLTCTVKTKYPSSVFCPLYEGNFEAVDENTAPIFTFNFRHE